MLTQFDEGIQDGVCRSEQDWLQTQPSKLCPASSYYRGRLGADDMGRCSSQPALDAEREGCESGGLLHANIENIIPVVRWFDGLRVDSASELGYSPPA